MKKYIKGNYSFNTQGLSKVIISSALISSMIFSMTGCNKGDNNLEINGLDITKITEYSEQYDLYLINNINKELITDKNVKALIDNSGIKYNIISASEYKSISNYSDKTIDDIKNLINSNNSLEENDKSLLIYAIDTLVEKGINLNTHILYANLKDLKVSYFDETPKDFDGVSNGKFNLDTRIMEIPSKKYIKKYGDGDYNTRNIVLVHELLGHGSLGYIDYENKVFVCYKKEILIKNKKDKNLSLIGTFIEEGLADLIAIESGIDKRGSGYPLNTYFVKTLMNVCEISFNDIYNNDVAYIAKKLESIGMLDSYDNLHNIDLYIYRYLFTSHLPMNDELFANMYISKLYTAYINYLYTEKNHSLEEVENIINSKIDDYKDIKYVENHGDHAIALVDDVNGAIYVRPSEIKKQCKQYINSLKNVRTK